jgi:hypothetical protein
MPMTFIITASLNHPDATPSWKNNYCFTDLAVDLFGEPLLDDATAAIKEISEQHYGKVIKTFTVEFTDEFSTAEEWMNEPIEPLVLSLDEPKEVSAGTKYLVTADSPRELREITCIAALTGHFIYATLCPMLLRYFDTPPEELYIKLTPFSGVVHSARS